MAQSLATDLLALGKALSRAISSLQDDGEIRKVTEVHFRPRVRQFTYAKGVSSYQLEYASETKEKWEWKDKSSFVDASAKTLPEYGASVQGIASLRDCTDAQAENLLNTFVNKLQDSSQLPPTEDDVLTLATIFISDLNESPGEWRLTVPIQGVWVEDGPLTIGKRITIRATAPGDLEDDPSDFPFYRSLPHQPSAILELAWRERSVNDAQSNLARFLDILRLFGLGSILELRAIYRTTSILLVPMASSPLHIPHPKVSYGLTAADADRLPQFASSVGSLLQSKIPDPFSVTADPVSIALQRYKDGLLQTTAAEGTITSAITALEALYLKARERAELSHRLSQRVAALLRHFGFEPLKVYDDISAAYEIRSSFIHGSTPTQDSPPATADLQRAALDYARLSILAFVCLPADATKDSLIQKLDNSLLNSTSFERVAKLTGSIAQVPLAIGHEVT